MVDRLLDTRQGRALSGSAGAKQSAVSGRLLPQFPASAAQSTVYPHGSPFPQRLHPIFMHKTHGQQGRSSILTACLKPWTKQQTCCDLLKPFYLQHPKDMMCLQIRKEILGLWSLQTVLNIYEKKAGIENKLINRKCRHSPILLPLQLQSLGRWHCNYRVPVPPAGP